MTMTSSYDQTKFAILSNLPLEFHNVIDELAGLMTSCEGGTKDERMKNLLLLTSKLEPVIHDYAFSQNMLGYDSGYDAGHQDGSEGCN